MKLLNTEQFGDVESWGFYIQLVAEAIWQEAEKLYDEDLFGMDVQGINGLPVPGINVFLACPNIKAPASCNAILWLIKKGIIATEEELNWNTLILTQNFILAQQEAKVKQLSRTARLAELFLTTNFECQQTMSKLGLSESLEEQLRTQKRFGILAEQLTKIHARAKRWWQDRLIDYELWNKNTLEVLTDYRQAKPEKKYA